MRSEPVADPESFHWVGIQYRNSAPQYATVFATVLRYLGRRKSRVVLSLPRTQLGPPLVGATEVGGVDFDTEALFSCHANPKYFLFHPSDRIFKCMYEVLNVGKKNN
jgi:hypothetical protein